MVEILVFDPFDGNKFAVPEMILLYHFPIERCCWHFIQNMRIYRKSLKK